MPAKKRRSPQEKKRLSYSRDRRNCYGENDKSSRKNIARNKRIRRRADRHHQRRSLAAAPGPVDKDTTALVEDRITRPRHGERGDRWRKVPDEQLGLHVAARLKQRIDEDISAAGTEQARITKVLRSTAIDRAELRMRRARRAIVPVAPEPQGRPRYLWCTTIVMVRDSFYPLMTPGDTGRPMNPAVVGISKQGLRGAEVPGQPRTR
jgi:hypothetical protein